MKKRSGEMVLSAVTKSSVRTRDRKRRKHERVGFAYPVNERGAKYTRGIERVRFRLLANGTSAEIGDEFERILIAWRRSIGGGGGGTAKTRFRIRNGWRR